MTAARTARSIWRWRRLASEPSGSQAPTMASSPVRPISTTGTASHVANVR